MPPALLPILPIVLLVAPNVFHDHRLVRAPEVPVGPHVGGRHGELGHRAHPIRPHRLVGFAVFVLGEKLTWNHAVGFGLVAIGAFFIFKGPLR